MIILIPAFLLLIFLNIIIHEALYQLVFVSYQIAFKLSYYHLEFVECESIKWHFIKNLKAVILQAIATIILSSILCSYTLSAGVATLCQILCNSMSVFMIYYTSGITLDKPLVNKYVFTINRCNSELSSHIEYWERRKRINNDFSDAVVLSIEKYNNIRKSRKLKKI